MKIESFKVEETETEIGELAADSSAAELIKSLGLAGQETLLDRTTDTRVAFRRMTKVEEDVYGLLFPEKSDVCRFDSEIIPVRVLELLKEATESGQYRKFEVWHARTKKEDPILVGLTGDPRPQSWDANYFDVRGRFLIARWGDALQPFKELISAAKKLWVAEQKLSLRKEIRERELSLEVVELEAEKKFSEV